MNGKADCYKKSNDCSVITRKDGEVIIVDEFTGRFMYGRRFNEGLSLIHILWERFICVSFIIISGVSFNFSNHTVRNGIIVSL